MKHKKQNQNLACEIPRPAIVMRTPDRILCTATTARTKENFLALANELVPQIPKQHLPIAIYFFAETITESTVLYFDGGMPFNTFDYAPNYVEKPYMLLKSPSYACLVQLPTDITLAELWSRAVLYAHSAPLSAFPASITCEFSHKCIHFSVFGRDDVEEWSYEKE